MKYLLTAILIPCLAIAAYSDEVRLTNGHTLVGNAREERGFVIVEMNFGTVGIPRADVHSIVPGRTLLHDYADRLSGLEICPDAASAFELALWARAHRLTRYVDGLLQQTIALDPEHEQARAMLGFVYHRGRWMSGLELKKALGWVESRGLWMAPYEPGSWPSPEALPARVSAGRKVHAPPEGVAYSLGLPRYSSRGTRNHGSGGYSLWGGVVPTRNLMDLPVLVNRTR